MARVLGGRINKRVRAAFVVKSGHRTLYLYMHRNAPVYTITQGIIFCAPKKRSYKSRFFSILRIVPVCVSASGLVYPFFTCGFEQIRACGVYLLR